jgi:hypothetical protein
MSARNNICPPNLPAIARRGILQPRAERLLADAYKAEMDIPARRWKQPPNCYREATNKRS